jgi:choline kinase
MKAVILAAGIGRRLMPLTREKPKALLEVGGKPILGYQLESLSRYFKMEDVIIVVGHCARMIEEYAPACTIVHNPRFQDTNNMYSLWLVKDFVHDGLLLLNSDVLFHPRILSNLLKSGDESAVVVDSSQKLGDEEMKVVLKGGRLESVAKTLNPSTASGEFIGVAKFSGSASHALFKEIGELIGKGAVNDWFESALAGIARRLEIRAVDTRGLPWVEIDSPADLERAKVTVEEMNGLAGEPE